MRTLQRAVAYGLMKAAIAIAWALAVFLSSFLTFVHFIPPQGILWDRQWQLRFLVPSCVVGVIWALALPIIRPGGLAGAIRSATLAFVASASVLAVQCGLTFAAGSEQQAWFGIPVLHIMFFAILVAGFMGLFQIDRKLL
jgi:hypothetical protein